MQIKNPAPRTRADASLDAPPERYLDFRFFRQDFMASIVVFLVALPLCMGIAIASGVSPTQGLITGIVGGLVAGALAGSPLQVSGPAAGLSVLVFELVQEHGLALLGPIVLLAGLMQIAAGALRLGQWFRAVSPAVVQGMLSGIGVLIVASQIHIVVDDKPYGSGWQNLSEAPHALWKGLTSLPHQQAAAIGLLTIAVILAWNLAPRRWQVLPAPLVAIVAAALAAWLFALPIKYIHAPEDLLGALTFPTAAGFRALWAPDLLVAALSLALIASAETLLSATAVDKLHAGPRTRYDHELMAQGAGNALCGLLGALPMTGVIVRSGANVASGARTRLSAMLHGCWLLLFIVALPFALNAIPTTALAAMLVYTGFKLISPQAVRQLKAFGLTEVWIYLATVGAIVATNLLEGVLLGLGLSLLKLLYTQARLRTRLVLDADGRGATLVLAGSATFLGLPRLAAELERVPPGTLLRLEIAQLVNIDHSCLELLTSWERQHRDLGGQAEIAWEALNRKYHDYRPSAVPA